MQKLTIIYQNHCAIYLASGGWCLLTRDRMEVPGSLLGTGACLLFYPPGFTPDKTFCAKAEAFCLRMRARLLWIENPSDDYPFWRCHALAGGFPLALPVSTAVLHLTERTHEEDSCLWFSGIFQAGADYFSVSEDIRLDLGTCEGILHFSVFCPKETDIFAALHSGLRYILPVEKTFKGEQSQTEAELTENHMTFFESGVLRTDEDITLTADVSPCCLLDENKTFLSLPSVPFTCGLFGTDIAEIVLYPEDGRLVPEVTASALCRHKGTAAWYAGDLAWCWSPSGSFRLCADSHKEKIKLIPGLSGSEFIGTDGAVRFVPHQNALLSEQMTETPHKTPASDTQNRTFSVPMTSWLSFRGNYYSSSDSMPLFSSENEKHPGRSLMAYIPLAASFEDQSPAAPVFPWKNAVCGISGTAEEAERLLRRARFTLLTGCPENTAFPKNERASETVAVSPCGLCIGVSRDTQDWNWVGIAQTSEGPLPDIRLCPVSASLRLALQKKDAYLLFTTDAQLRNPEDENMCVDLPVCGFHIRLSADTWIEGQTLMLLKYTDTVTVRELLEDSPQLSHLLSLAFSGDGEVRQEYRELISVLDDPDYQGILLLGAAVSPVNVSREIEAVLKDIPEGGLRAVYTLIPKSGIEITSDGGIKIGLSDISSYFFYKGESLTNERLSRQTLDLRTTDFAVIIRHNTMTGISARMELLVTELFGSPLTPAEDFADSCLVLKGQMETVSDTSILRFKPEAAKAFLLPGTPVSRLVLQDACMECREECTEFQLTGNLSFLCEETCDLFSYEQIGFTGIRLIREPDRFYADYQGAALLPESAALRRGSLAEAFGAAISGVCFCQDTLPDDQGFFSINTPVRQGALKSGWNGIIWELSLGSSGELGASENLSLEFLAAWNRTDYYFGIRFPGVLNRSFQLQGLITAGFTGIDLILGEKGGLCLRLHGFTVKLLGLSFPRNGTEMFLLAEHGNIAWYAGYDDKDKEVGSS